MRRNSEENRKATMPKKRQAEEVVTVAGRWQDAKKHHKARETLRVERSKEFVCLIGFMLHFNWFLLPILSKNPPNNQL